MVANLICYSSLVFSDTWTPQTVFSSVVVNHLQQTYASQRCPVICLYLNYKETSLQTSKNLLGSLLKQLIQLQSPSSLSSDVLDWYEKAKTTKVPPKEKDIRTVLKKQVASYDRVYLIVDALDECPFRQRLLAELRDFPPEKLSLMVTSRPIDGEERADIVDCDVCKAVDVRVYFRCSICQIDLCSNCEAKDNPCKAQSHTLAEPFDRVEVTLKTPPEEIQQYVEWELSKEIGEYGSKLWDHRRYSSRPDATKLGRKCQKNPDLIKRIPDVIVDRADGRFLFAKLYLDSLRSKHTLRQIQETLDSFPDDLDKIYEEALQRIKDQKDRNDGELGMKTIARIFCARRPLSLAELQHALAIEPGQTDCDDYMDYDMEDILAACAGLIIIDGDEKDVRLVHLTLQTYLDYSYEQWIPQAKIEMAQICLTYLNYDVLSVPCDNEDFEERRQKYPFIAYASQYWGTHARSVRGETDVDQAALQLVSDRHRVAAYVQAAWFTDNRGSSSWDCRRGIEGLHVCAWLGLDNIIGESVDEGADMDIQETTFGQTPLMYACRAGHVEAARILLDHAASVNVVSGRGRTALFEAIAEDREDVVELLLNQEDLQVNAVNPEESNRTGLMLAAYLGLSRVVDRLLEHHNIHINQQDSDGSTALSLATTKNHYTVVESLLGKTGIQVNLRDHSAGRSALILAAERDNRPIIELLLDNGADPMLRDNQGGGTALQRAVDYHCLSAIDLMIQRKIDLKKCIDDDGRGLLHSASTNGWPDIVRLLIENGLSPNERDKYRMTPLHDASRMGNDNVSKVLLELAADPSLEDKFHRDPRLVAWQYGHVDIMNILDGKNESDGDTLESIPEPEKLPGWSLAKLGLHDLLEQAITAKRKGLSDVEPITNDNALHHSLHGNHLGILQMLLASRIIPPNNTNVYGRTPLHLAAIYGNVEAATELIEYNANLDLQDRWGRTPLLIAQTNHHYSLAITLIEAGATIDPQAINIQTLLFMAIPPGSVKAVAALIKSGANILDRNPEGLTPLQVAKAADQGEIMQLLRTSKSFRYAAVDPGDLDEAKEVEGLEPVMSPEAEHEEFVPFRSRMVAV